MPPPRDMGTDLEELGVGLQGEVLREQGLDGLEEGSERGKVLVEQTAALHQVQTGRETGHPVQTHTHTQQCRFKSAFLIIFLLI